MPNRIIIEHYNAGAGEYWTNRYYTTAPVNDAGATLDALVAAHVGLLRANSIVTKARIDDNVEDTDNYDTVSYNQAGTVLSEGEATLPLFVVCRIDFDVTGGGRPSRKYFRGRLTEGDYSFSGLAAGTITAMNTFGDAVVAIGTICDPQGNLFVDAVPWPYAAMRQLRRGSKKKITP